MSGAAARRGIPSVQEAVANYAAGAFPMDDRSGAREIPWYVADERAVLMLDHDARAALRRRVRRSLRACADLEWRVDADFAGVVARCAEEREPGDGVWITPRMQTLYARLHEAGVAHSFELWTREGEHAAGILGVLLGRAALLESMRALRPHAGNALLSRTVDELAARGVRLCDIQLPTPHTLGLGARLIAKDDYEARLAAALDEDVPGA